MNTSAIILMSIVWLTVISLTIYFFTKILKKPELDNPDNHVEDGNIGD